jgi:hypothetical protein
MWFSEAVTGTEYLCLIGNAAQQIEQTQSRLPQLDALVIVIFIFTHVMRRLQMPSDAFSWPDLEAKAGRHWQDCYSYTSEAFNGS